MLGLTNALQPDLNSARHSPLLEAWRWLTANGKKMLPARENRRLRVAETVSLGDRRFVVLLEADGEHFLVGASGTGVSLLTRLSGPGSQETSTAAACAGVTECSPAGTDANQSQAHADPLHAAVVPGPAAVLAATGETSRAASSSAAPAASQRLIETIGNAQARAAGPNNAVDTRSFPLSASGRRHAFPLGTALGLVLAAQFFLAPAPSAAQASAAPQTPAVSSQRAATPTTTTHKPMPSMPLDSAKSGLSLTGLGGSSAPWTIVVLLTVLTLIPSLMICMTPFARLLVVFHFLRQALGLQTTPSNQTLIGLSLILTFFIMQPLGKQIYTSSFVPLQNGQITALEAVDRGSEPLRHFMAHYVREKDAALFLEIAHAPQPRTIEDVSLRVLMPAYIVSELKAGFQIGAVLFLPFLVVDIVIASITTSVGMMQLPPVVISTPLKLMLFLMVDGWHLLISALVRSFY